MPESIIAIQSNNIFNDNNINNEIVSNIQNESQHNIKFPLSPSVLSNSHANLESYNDNYVYEMINSKFSNVQNNIDNI